MKTLNIAIILIFTVSITSNSVFAQNVTNSTNSIQPIPYSILRSASPTLTPSETQSLVKIALGIPELQEWSHDWHYADMGFLGNNNLATGGFEWQYAIINLKSPSDSAPIPCDNDWWAWIEVDMTTMKVVWATYPTMESHQCQVATGGGPGTSSIIASVIESPLKQFKSGIKAENVKCADGFTLVIKSEDGSPACVTIKTGIKLVLREWAATFGTGISTHDYYTKCDIPYQQYDTGIAVLYMPTNTIGEICIQYHNLNNASTTIGMRVFEANDLTHNATDVTAWTHNSTLEENANKTVVYFIKTGNKAGFYGASLNCGGIPLAVGYDNNSAITTNDFPWVGQAIHCGAITYESHIEGTTGIGVKYIPYP